MNLLQSKLCLFALCFLSVLQSYSQNTSLTLSSKFNELREKLPSDKLFLHTDRNLYQPGDTIFFQNYIDNRFTQKFETSSLSSWVMLMSSGGETIDSARFRINFATAPGWLAIPDDCIPGWYRLKSFTSQMQKYSPEFASSSWIRIDELIKDQLTFNYRFNQKHYQSKDTVELKLEFKNSDGQLVKNTWFTYGTPEKGKSQSTFRAKTTRKGISLLRIFLPDSLEKKNVNLEINLEKGLGEFRVDIPVLEENPLIRFLPEGGTFIPGYKQKVAFNGVKPSGEQLFLSGVLRNENGEILDSLKSGKHGPGLLEFTPKAGNDYYVEFSDYPSKQWPLPKTESLLPCINASYGNNKIVVRVSGNNRKQSYFLALTKNHKLVAFVPFALNRPKRIVFNTDSLPSGMATVTLFSEEMQPIAERALFLPQKNAPHFEISTQSDFYRPEEQTTLEVEIKRRNNNCSGIFSIAMVDSSTALSPQINLQNINDCFLFEEEFYKRLPFHIKQIGLQNLAAEELDLLLLTYGWTVFDLGTRQTEKRQELTNYDQFKIELSKTHSSRRREKINKSTDPILALSIDEPALLELNKGKKGTYLLNVDSIPSFTNNIMLVPNFGLKNKINGANFNPVINRQYSDWLKTQKESKTMPTMAPHKLIGEHTINLDSFRILKEISVTAKREPTKKFVNEYEKRYQGVSTRTLGQRIIEATYSFESLLFKLYPYRLDTRAKQVYLNPPRQFSGGGPALFVLDGNPIHDGNTYSSLTSIMPSNIHSITAIKGVAGYYLYGEVAASGVVFVETKVNHIGDEYELTEKINYNRGDLVKILELFRANREFYNPPQVALQNDPQLWIRPTLYWNHEVFYDGEKPVKIEYFNHKKKGTVLIIINGVTEDGEPVSGIHRYRVK